MTTTYPIQQHINFSEVYYKDIHLLKSKFLDVKNCTNITEEFGLPFLLIKKRKNIIGFASLITTNNKISFNINYFGQLHEDDKTIIHDYVQNYFKIQKTANFTYPLQLKSSINNLIYWLNS